ncbi:MAG: hypothetical protein ABL909_05235 [Sphingopyxis sp.]
MHKSSSALIFALTLVLALSACSAPDQAALAKGDDAFKGQMVDGQLRAVAARSVMVGAGGAEADACGALARPKGESANIRWSNDPASPIKAEGRGDVWACEVDGAWTGVIFPAHGQSTSDCNVASPVRTAREYQGPCRWGWTLSADLAVTAG